MNMDLNSLFIHREDWQRSAFKTIKQNLISARNNRFVQYDTAQEEHLVIIYGKSQVGKTTLILTMIGIREGKCLNEVNETLRAGIPRGNSSTSTAIIYSRSEDDRYGCAIATINHFPPQDVPSYDREGMIQRLKEIRADVESGIADADSILYITIPKYCFTEQTGRERIFILDMPGIESRNHREDDHVRNLTARYFPIASVCIIACRSNDIQSLEITLDDINWKRMEHRFVLVITHAYSDGTIKRNYFNRERSSREKGFYQHIMNIYTKNIRTILGESNQTMIYPVDVGNSMERLSRELTSEDDRRELLETRNKVLSDLRGWIVSHRDNRLKAALDNLRDVVEHAGEDAIREKDREIAGVEKDIETARRAIKRAEKQIQNLIGNNEPDKPEEDRESDEDSEDMSQRDGLLVELRTLRESREKLLAFGGVTGLYQALEMELRDNKLELSEDGAYWKDKKKIAYSAMREIAVEKVAEAVKEVTDQVKTLKPSADIFSSVRAGEIDRHCTMIWNTKSPTHHSPFKKDLVHIDKLKDVCGDVENTVNQNLNQVILSYIQWLDKELRKKEDEIKNVEQRARNRQASIRQKCAKVKDLEKDLKTYTDRRAQLERRKQQDQKTLEMYLDYTEQAYEEQRSRIIDQINSRLSSRDKLTLILFLGVLDRDHQKVTGGII